VRQDPTCPNGFLKVSVTMAAECDFPGEDRYLNVGSPLDDSVLWLTLGKGGGQFTRRAVSLNFVQLFLGKVVCS
jgi:hypothetical protein